MSRIAKQTNLEAEANQALGLAQEKMGNLRYECDRRGTVPTGNGSSQGRDLALTGLFVPNLLDSGQHSRKGEGGELISTMLSECERESGRGREGGREGGRG